MAFGNQFKSQKNVNRGSLAKSAGDEFENILSHMSQRQRIVCTRIPDGCKMIRTRLGAVVTRRVKTPFDFLLAKDGMSACIDCKSVQSGNFSFSMIEMHQVTSLIQLFDNKIPAGYLVYFRDVNIVTFFKADSLYHLKRRESFKPEDGLQLGTKDNFSLQPILELFKAA